MNLTLSPKQLRFLRSRAHTLEPRLSLGKQGASEGVRRELEALLAQNELIKVRIGKFVKLDLDALAKEFGAAVVHKVGRNLVLYRPAPEPTIQLPSV